MRETALFPKQLEAPNGRPSLVISKKSRDKGPSTNRKVGRLGKRKTRRLVTPARSRTRTVLQKLPTPRNGVTPYDQTVTPLREWDRGTQFLSAFVVSGFID